jgi:hypothetical protein
MNCQEITQLLDDGDIRNVPPAQRRELDAHLAGCANCAAEWRVQERIVMTPDMWVPPGFVAQCRRLVAAGVARLVPRPSRVILYCSLLALAAVAALLAWRYGNPAASPVVATTVIEAPVQAPAQVEPAAEPATEPAKPAPHALPAGAVTVTVRPLQIEGGDTEGNALAEHFRERVMALLQGVPNLVLVDTPSAAGDAAAAFELRMKYTAPTTPEILSRMVSLEVGKSAEFAATEAAIAAEAKMSPEDRQRSELARQLADTRKRGPATRSGNSGVTLLLGMGSPRLAIFYDRMSPTDRLETAAERLVRDLRINVFPLDESFEQEELATLRNPSQRQGLRMRALGALLIYAERRGGFTHASPDVVRAGGEYALVAEAQVATQRGAIWDTLALTGSPELVPYLIRGLNEIALTETRLQLVKILTENYADDPRAQAALAAAAKSNDQQTVRMAAMRGAGDSAWHEYVVATLGNLTLSDTQRLQPIADMAPGALGTLGTSPKTKMALEEHQLRELGALIIKVAPDRTANEIAQKALFAAGAMETPAALDMLIEVSKALRAENYAKGMEGVAVMGVRGAANNLISMRYAGNPQARAVIEDLARNGDAMEKMMAEVQLRSMDMKADMDKVRKGQPPTQ